MLSKQLITMEKHRKAAAKKKTSKPEVGRRTNKFLPKGSRLCAKIWACECEGQKRKAQYKKNRLNLINSHEYTHIKAYSFITINILTIHSYNKQMIRIYDYWLCVVPHIRCVCVCVCAQFCFWPTWSACAYFRLSNSLHGVDSKSHTHMFRIFFSPSSFSSFSIFQPLFNFQHHFHSHFSTFIPRCVPIFIAFSSFVAFKLAKLWQNALNSRFSHSGVESIITCHNSHFWILEMYELDSCENRLYFLLFFFYHIKNIGLHK